MESFDDLTRLIADVRERLVYMQELGLEELHANLPKHKIADSRYADNLAAPPAASKMVLVPTTRTAPTDRPAGSRLAGLPTLSKRKGSQFFDKYNPGESDAFPIRPSAEIAKTEKPADALFEIVPTLPEPVETVEQIRAEIGPDCTRCKLGLLGRTQVVNSVGNFNADLMFVGEAPGADEDRMGEPFVGRAGQLLTDIIRAIGFERSDVFIGNINRCRPPANRAPEADECSVCKPFLLREIAVVRPRVIVVLGNTATQNLLEIRTPISKLRGNFQDYFGVKVMPTFHPAYLLRDPHKKREVWEDMKKVRDYLLHVSVEAKS